MNGIRKNCNIIYTVTLLVWSAVNYMLYSLNYMYRPKNYAVFFGLYIALTVFAGAFSGRSKAVSGKASKILAYFMFLPAMLFVATLFFSFDFSVNYKTYDIAYYAIMFAAIMTFSFVIFFIYNSLKWLKLLVAFFLTGPIALLGLILFFFLGFVFEPLGETKILQTVKSPDNTFAARVISSDEGALGGDTSVEVYNEKNDIMLIAGKLVSQRKAIWTGAWDANPSVSWEDNETVLIDGVRYNISNDFKTTYANKYRARLKVYVPQRSPDYDNDTHGGFNGDGSRIQKYVLSEDETKLVKKDTENNENWKKLDEQSKNILFGGAEGYFSSGLLEGEVPETENGYYCFYDKHNHSAEFPGIHEYSFNYIAGVYSADDNILYIFESDT